MRKNVVAIVGRPNVGKSTLFNKLAGRRISIVEDTPGVTRDRIYCECEWRGIVFDLIDTGGIEPENREDVILSSMREQALVAINSADVIIFMTDVRTGVTATDAEIASMIKKSGKNTVLCVNKVDSVGNVPPEVYEFYSLGLGDPYPVSSVHGAGTGDMLDAVFEYFPTMEGESEEDEMIKVALIGKPNVGKSSLLNRLAGEERAIVSNIAGTTRDAIDSRVENQYGKYLFVDTAGLRRKSKVDEDIEKFSVMRTQLAVERADVCIIMIDAETGFTEQDAKVAGLAADAGKALIVAVNKWDAIDKETGTMKQYDESLQLGLSFMSYAPYIYISAKTGQRCEALFPLINEVAEESARRITTGKLNEVLADATMRVQPPTDKGKRLKVMYMTQSGTKPPTFVVFVNSKELFHFSYQRYIENRIREVFGFKGTPIRFIVREREKEQY